MNRLKYYSTALIHHPIISATYHTLLNIISPPYCTACRHVLADRTILCTSCRATIHPIVSTTLSITERHKMCVMAIADYREPLKSLILAKSWSDIVAAQQLGNLIWEYSNIRHTPFDYIVPIPLHWTRYAWRGFNQTEVMGNSIAQASGKPLISLITRKRSTPFQSSLSFSKRAQNVDNAFALNTNDPALYLGKHILLVDDLMTTGSTLKEAGKALLALKPSTITAVVVCRVVV